MANPNEKRQLINTLYQAGFRDNALRTAFGIAMRESGGRAAAYNPDRSTGDDSYGLFQINMLGEMGPARRRQFGLQSNQELLDPQVNAKAAFRMSKGGRDFGAWGIGPNAYRQGAGFDTIKQYYDEFPRLRAQQVKNLETTQLATQTAKNLTINATQPKDPYEVGAYSAKAAQLHQNQESISDEVRQYMAGQARRNQLISAAGTSDTTRRLLGQLGSVVASKPADEISLPSFDPDMYRYRPKVPTLKDEAAAQQWGGTAQPPLSKKTGNVPGVADPNMPKQMQDVLKIAHDQIGTPYVWGQEDPKSGFDCSGLIEYAFEKAGIKTPGRLTTYSMAKLGKSVKDGQYLPGDWVITNGGKHVVMYVGKGKVIAAPHSGTVVQYQDLDRFKGDIVDVRRFR